MSGVTRDISTRLQMQGEAEYKAGMAQAANALKTLISEGKLLDSSFQGQRNTLTALEQKHKNLAQTLAAQQEKQKLEKARLDEVKAAQARFAEGAEQAREKLAALQSVTDDGTKDTDEYKAALKAASGELEKQERLLALSEQAMADQTKATNDAQIKVNSLGRELSENEKHLQEAASSADGCATSIDGFGKAAKDAADDAGEATQNCKMGIEELAKTLAAAGITATVKEIAQALMACVDASVDFESAMAGVAKTTDMSREELSAMGEKLKAMSMEIPIAASELAQIAEIAGQLGVAKEDLTAFTDVMAKLAVATNLTSEESATMLAQFANITGMSLSDVDKLGSAIVALGNNFATDEKRIVEMSQRMASAGTIAGLTEQEILALSTSMASVGIEAEAGGTAMSQTLTKMENAVEEGGDALESFAQVSGMSSEAFAQTWKSSPITAIQAFVGGLNGMVDAGQSVGGVLDELGLKGIRQGNLLRSLALSSDKLSQAVTLSNKAWKDNNALAKEAETRFTTTESRMTLYKNSVEAVKIAIGDQLTPALGALVDAGKNVNEWATEFIQRSEWLGPAITGVVAALGALAAGVVAVTVVVPALKLAWGALSAVISSHPVILAASALIGLAAGIATAVAAAKDGAEEMTKAADDLPSLLEAADRNYADEVGQIEGTAAKAEALLKRIKELEQIQASSGLEGADLREWNALLKALVDTVPELSDRIDLQTGTIDGGTAALTANTSAWRENAMEQAKQRAMQAKYDAYGDAVSEQAENQVKLAEATYEADEAYAAWYEKLDKIAAVSGHTREELSKLNASELNGIWRRHTGNVFSSKEREELDQLNKAASTAAQKVATYSKAVEEGREKTEAAAAAVDTYGKAVEDVFGESAGAADDVRTLTDAEKEQLETLESTKSALIELSGEFDAAYKDAMSGLNSTVHGFTKIEDPIKQISAKDAMANLDSQLAFLIKYQSNMEQLKTMAADLGITLDAGLVSKLSDGSAESAAIVAGMIDAGGDAIKGISDKYGQVATNKETAATVMADMRTDFCTVSDEMVQKLEETVEAMNQSDAAAAAARETMEAFNAEFRAGSAQTAAIAAYVNSLTSTLGAGPAPTHRNPNYTAHASGLTEVPYNEYPAMLHKGERVLTALQARAMDAESKMTYSYPEISVAALGPGGGAAQREAIDYDRLGASVARALSGVSVNIDGERAGDLLTERISRNIAGNA